MARVLAFSASINPFTKRLVEWKLPDPGLNGVALAELQEHLAECKRHGQKGVLKAIKRFQKYFLEWKLFNGPQRRNVDDELQKYLLEWKHEFPVLKPFTRIPRKGT
jgi:hypothetical protein